MVEDLKKIIETKRECRVVRIKRLSKATMTDVFKVETDKDTVVARIFKKKDFPDCKKLIWIDAALQAHKIDSARVLFCTQESKPFRYGFMLLEYVDGRDGWSAMKSGDVSLRDYFVRLGKLLRQIHAIKVGKTGAIKISSFDNDFQWFEKLLTSFQSKVNFPNEVLLEMQRFVIQTLSCFSPRFKSVLCHCDLGPYNTIYTKEGGIIPIDWDLAEAGSLFRDFAPITMAVKEMDDFGERESVIREIQEFFLEGYGKTGFTIAEIQRILDAHHLISLIYNALACGNTLKDKKHLANVKKEIGKIMNNYSI